MNDPNVIVDPTIDAERDDGEYSSFEESPSNVSTREKRTKERERACLKRTDDGGWCILHHRHTSVCKSVPMQYGPLPPPPDRKLMAAFRLEISEKYDTKVRNYFWTDRHGETVKPGFSPAMWWEACAIAPFDR